jgi:hypothetical protein
MRSRTRRCSHCRSSRASRWADLRDFAERESENEELREQAIFWLGQNGSADNANYLKTLFGRVKSDALKEKIIFSLSQQRGFGNGEWIMNIALDPKAEHRDPEAGAVLGGPERWNIDRSVLLAIRQDDGRRDQGAADLRLLAEARSQGAR